MPRHFHFTRLASLVTGWAIVAFAAGLAPDARAAVKAESHASAAPQHSKSSAKARHAKNAKASPKAKHAKAPQKAHQDLSGQKRVGQASVYAKKFTGKKMADGTRMSPHDDNAASKTLPLGTRAKVTNLETGKSANVTIQDRGPYAKGRIVDLSPATAQKIGIGKKDGVAKVKVEPITVPMPDGSVKPGVAAKDGKARKPASGSQRR